MSDNKQEIDKEKVLEIKEKKEQLSHEQLMEIVNDWVEREKGKYIKKFESIGKKIEKHFTWENVMGFIVDKIFPLLYFPAWKEMWKMREEERMREILYASVGKCRNTFEWVISCFGRYAARDTTDYERRYQMISVKKEIESLAGQDESYLRYELYKALKAQKLDRAEACLRLLHPDANFNEVFRDPKLATLGFSEEEKKKLGDMWNTPSAYFWLVKQFGRKRAQYMFLDLAKDFSHGINNADMFVYLDPETGEFVERDPWDRAIASSIHFRKIGVRVGWRTVWTWSLVSEDLNTEARKEIYDKEKQETEKRYEELTKKESELRKIIKEGEDLKEKLKMISEKRSELEEELKMAKIRKDGEAIDEITKAILENKKEEERTKEEVSNLKPKYIKARQELRELSWFRSEEFYEDRVRELKEKKVLSEDEERELKELEEKVKQREEDEKEYQDFNKRIEKGEKLSEEEKMKYDLLKVRLKKIKARPDLHLLGLLCQIGGADLIRPIDEDIPGDTVSMLYTIRHDIEDWIMGRKKIGEYYMDYKTGKIKYDARSFEEVIRAIYLREFKKELTLDEIEKQRKTIRCFLLALEYNRKGIRREEWPKLWAEELGEEVEVKEK